MKKIFSILMLAMLAACTITMVSCKDDPDEPTGIRITNNSSYSFNRFTVVYLNDKSNNDGEIISTQDFGTLNPQGSVTSTIPAGASYYYLYMVNGSESYVSADYAISVINLNIDNNFRWYN